MESNASLERRGSLFFSPSMLDAVDHAVNKEARSPSPEHATKGIPTERPKRELPTISISRHRNQSETQYADTEVSHQIYNDQKYLFHMQYGKYLCNTFVRVSFVVNCALFQHKFKRRGSSRHSVCFKVNETPCIFAYCS